MGGYKDYRVLSDTKHVPGQGKHALIFTTGQPTTFMGKPKSGTATIIFSHMNDSAPSPRQKL